MSVFDPRVLARIERLELRARQVVEGFMIGVHRSPYRGISTDFAEHRLYSQETTRGISIGKSTPASIASTSRNMSRIPISKCASWSIAVVRCSSAAANRR